MQVERLEIPDVLLITPKTHGDARGFFSETFRADVLAAAGVHLDWLQDNHSMSAAKWTLRGLHLQSPPHAQDKLIRVVRGAIYDVAVDVRHGSPTFGRFVAAVLTAQNRQQLLVPKGFLHAFLTIEDHTEVIYKVTDYYAPDCDAGVRWDDPDLAIPWPLEGAAPVLSAKDAALPLLRETPAWFGYEAPR